MKWEVKILDANSRSACFLLLVCDKWICSQYFNYERQWDPYRIHFNKLDIVGFHKELVVNKL